MAPDPVTTAARYATAAMSRVAVRAIRAELVAAVVDPVVDPRIRAGALGALVRAGTQGDGRRSWVAACTDPDASVRHRAAELTPRVAAPPLRSLLPLVEDPDALVAEAAAWAAGEVSWSDRSRTRVVSALTAAAGHADPLVREAAVAALGALADPAGLPVILAACADRPAVRRRAVLALAPFEGPAVEDAIVRALTDPDWQTRQAAEDLARPPI